MPDIGVLTYDQIYRATDFGQGPFTPDLCYIYDQIYEATYFDDPRPLSVTVIVQSQLLLINESLWQHRNYCIKKF